MIPSTFNNRPRDIVARDLAVAGIDCPELWDGVRNRRILITGGTGFVGCWMLEALLWANDHYELNAEVVVFSRTPTRLRAKGEHLAEHPAVRLEPGDVRTSALPGNVDIVVHAAASVGSAHDPSALADAAATIVTGTARVLEHARRVGSRRVLVVSSGAVYGAPPSTRAIGENECYPLTESGAGAVYGQAKRDAEAVARRYCCEHGVAAVIARPFTVVGPYSPLDGHFAIASFLRDALAGRTVCVKGGSAIRSLMHGADLAVWLWTALLRGTPGTAYNIGSREGIAVVEAARALAACFTPPRQVLVEAAPTPSYAGACYVPCVERATRDLGVAEHFTWRDALRRTVEWFQAGGGLGTDEARQR